MCRGDLAESKLIQDMGTSSNILKNSHKEEKSRLCCMSAMETTRNNSQQGMISLILGRNTQEEGQLNMGTGGFRRQKKLSH